MTRLFRHLAFCSALAGGLSAGTAGAQTVATTHRVEAGIGVSGAIGGSFAEPYATVRVNFTRSLGADVSGNLAGDAGTYVLAVHYTGSSPSRRLAPYLTAGAVGTIEFHSGQGFSERLRATGDTLVHPAFSYTRVSAPLAAAIGGGVRVALAPSVSLDLNGQVCIARDLGGVPIVLTAALVVGFGKVH